MMKTETDCRDLLLGLEDILSNPESTIGSPLALNVLGLLAGNAMRNTLLWLLHMQEDERLAKQICEIIGRGKAVRLKGESA
jgi:hypothetical protein